MEIITLQHYFTEVTDPISCPNMTTLSISLSIKIVICISEESGAICKRVYINRDYEKNEIAIEMVSTSKAAHTLWSSPWYLAHG